MLEHIYLCSIHLLFVGGKRRAESRLQGALSKQDTPTRAMANEVQGRGCNCTWQQTLGGQQDELYTSYDTSI